MCGVLGLLTQSAQAEAENQNFSEALKLIDHRGPDARGELSLLNCRLKFGHTRLSILDLSEAGSQPMSAGSGHLVYNGEVYNHLELRSDLRHSFKGHSDTETLLAGLNQKGLGFLESCRGMFAGAFFDSSGQKLILFRDPIGIKPMYWVKHGGTFAFGSEIKALRRLVKSRPKVNRSVLNCYLNYENFPQEHSLFEGVVALKPGEVVSIDVESLRIDSHHLPTPWHPMDEVPQPEAILKELKESVEAHLLSDVPVAVYLSGGLDTSTVATLAAGKQNAITGFTGYFDVGDKYYDETDLSELVARKAGIGYEKIPITAKDFKDHFEDLTYFLDEPRMGMGSFSQYVVAKRVAQSHKVILSGHGGDELFAGYPKFKAAYLMSSRFPVSEKLEMVKNIKPREVALLGYSVLNKVLSGGLPAAPRINENFENDSLDGAFQIFGSDSISGVHDYYLNVYLPGLLMVEDRISMASSLETRVPLLDRRVISAAMSVPIAEHLRGGILKAYMKRSVSELLPKELITGPKRGFPTPLRMWFRNELYDYLREQLFDDYRLSSLVPKFLVEELVKSHLSPAKIFAFDERRAHKIWMYLCLNVWMRRFGITEI